MPNIIDRRLNSRDRNLTNRQKFLERAKGQIKKAVEDAIVNGNIGNIDSKKVNVPIRGITEPTFTNDRATGDKQYVLPGNEDFVVGDKLKKPEGGGSGKGNQAGDDGEGEDEFTFTLTKEEFLEYFFDNLELPDLVKKQISEIKKETPKRSGYTTVGNPSQLDVRATTKQALGRRIALKRPHIDDIKELERQLEEAMNAPWEDQPFDTKLVWEIQQKLEKLKKKIKAVPWIDPVDTRYRLYVPQPMPITKAVMICLMDVSGSMNEREKTLAKKFFILLSILLHRKYENVEIVFIRHHTQAEECNEHDFFHKKESGGTIVSSGLKLANEIISARYPINEWNIYMAQGSDGDNFHTDNEKVLGELKEMVPKLQYFAYLDIPNSPSSVGTSDLWKVYDTVKGEYKQLQMRQARNEKDIWDVFKDLFSKKGTE